MPEQHYYKGIFCPVFSSSFKDEAVEQSYQKYSRRQRQKSFTTANIIDLAIKVGLVIVYSLNHASESSSNTKQIVWTATFACMNVAVCFLIWWRSFAKNHLHWVAVGTWMLFIVQGLSKQGIGFQESQNQVWYMLFVVFVPYAMFPLSVCWCVSLGVLSFLVHVMATIVDMLVDTGSTNWHYHGHTCAWRVLGGNVLLYAAVNFAGLYAKSFVDCEQRKVFMETRTSKSAYEKTKIENDKTWSLIQSVIPDFLAKNIANFMCEDVGNFEQMLDMVTYRSHYDVSILFADIKGFTDLSSKCSAQELVELLNSLFARFDKLSSENHCLRIKLLGDCYFCVSGLLKPRDDHAHCCVNLGLHMIQAIRDLRREMKDLAAGLDMRIGIHSGKVLCAVLGQLKWQFDLWSHDVTIANHIESSGRPGRVHISSSTFEFLKGAFKVEPGDGGTRDSWLEEHHPVTYFIDSTEQPLKTSTSSTENGSEKTKSKLGIRSNHKQTVKDWKPEMPFENYYHGDVHELQPKTVVEEADQIHRLIEATQEHIHTFSLMFKREDLELCFKEVDGETFKSNVMCCMVQWLFVVAVQTLAHYNCSNLMIVLTVMTIPLTLCFVLVMVQEFPNLQCHLVKFSATVTKTRILRVMHICFFIFIMSLSSTLKLYICPPGSLQPLSNTTNTVMPNSTDIAMSNSTDTMLNNGIVTDKCHHPEYVVFTWVLCLVALTSVLKLYFLIKTLLATVNFVMYCILIVHYYMYYETENMLLLPAQMLVLICGFLVVVVIHARLVEAISRLDFLWKRQVKTDLALMETAQGMNKQLLEHILPDHVVNHFLSKDWRPDNLYSQKHDEVGVLFACIPNFDTLQRERSAHQSLRVLNNIILCFDELLLQPEFKCIEKIKTINATYMAASGLDPKHKEGQGDHDHLYALCDYAMALREALKNLLQYQFREPSNYLRVGISCGPLVGGVIGARKPVYDIWGNTVNEASRMESTGEMGQIQVTKHTQQLLKNRFMLEYRGEVEVKGKGMMETWWVTERLQPKCYEYLDVIRSFLCHDNERMPLELLDLWLDDDDECPTPEQERKMGNLKKCFGSSTIFLPMSNTLEDTFAPMSTNTSIIPRFEDLAKNSVPSEHPFSALIMSIKHNREQMRTHPLYKQL